MKKLISIIALCALDQALGQAAERFDFHSIRKEPAASVRGIYEGETHLRTEGKARPQDMRGFGNGWRGDAHLLWDGVVGDVNAVEFEMETRGKYALAMQWTLAPDYGVFEVLSLIHI